MDVLLYTLLAIIILLLLPRNIAKWILAIVITLAIIVVVLFLILAYFPDIDWGFVIPMIITFGIVIPVLKEIDKIRHGG